jgi:hypothetical protein
MLSILIRTFQAVILLILMIRAFLIFAEEEYLKSSAAVALFHQL